jgi:hypothetical protein
LTGVPPFRRSFSVALAAALGVILVPLVLWGLLPGLPARLESSEGFSWAGAETGTGHPLLLREQADGRQIVAGSERFGISRDEPVRCYNGPAEPLREAARARGRIEDLTLRTGFFHRLTITTDDLGGGETTYIYRCGANGAEPLLAWGALPRFGVRALALAAVAWLAVWLVVRGVMGRWR